MGVWVVLWCLSGFCASLAMMAQDPPRLTAVDILSALVFALWGAACGPPLWLYVAAKEVR